MGTFTVTGNDTLTLNGHVFTDLATDDVVQIEFPDDLINMKTGKNGNSLFALNQKGYNANVMLKINRGSTDDQFLAGILANMPNDFPSMQLLSGTFVKRLGDGQGNVISDVYSMQGGVISKVPSAVDNESGDVNQAETTYRVKFAVAGRIIS